MDGIEGRSEAGLNCTVKSWFLCLKNICSFLGACQKTFKIPQQDLFEAWELYKAANFAKVLHTLSKLSLSAVAVEQGVKGFPQSDVLSQAHPETSAEYYNDEIYRNLAEEADKKELNEEIYALNESHDNDLEYGKIYDEIVLRSRQDARVSSRQSQRPLPKEPERDPFLDFVPVDKRGHCIKELIDSESNYVDALNMLLQKFYQPLHGVLSPDDHKIVFMNLQELAQIHTAFFSELRASVRAVLKLPSPSASVPALKTGEVFLRWKQKLVCYSEYCSKLSQAQLRLDRLSAESPSTRQKILECQAQAASANNNRQFRLQDLLAVPMQRVLKYHLLIRELERHTPVDDRDRALITDALNAMLDLSAYINEVKRDCETLQAIKDIQNNIQDLTMPKDTELKDYGRLQKDGEIKILSHSDKNAKWKLRYMFIFDRVILVCKALKSNTYCFKYAISLMEYKLRRDIACNEGDNNNRSFGSLIKSTTAKALSYTWCLVHDENSNILQMQTKSEEQKIAWLSAIEAAYDNIYPLAARDSEHDLTFTTFDQPTQCDQCNLLMRGLFFQGYQCALCGCISHKQCIRDAKNCAELALMLQRRSTFRNESFNSTSTTTTNSMTGRRLKATQSFIGNNGGPDMLCFKTNDLIEIITINTNVDGWYKGRVIEGANIGRAGLFPAHCVNLPSERSKISVSRNESHRSHNEEPISIAPQHSRQQSTLSNASFTSGVIHMPTAYANLEDLSKYDWFMGAVGREMADYALASLPDGSYLVRYSERQNRYAISLSYNGEVKHVKIEQSDDATRFYLDIAQQFASVVELINYYGTHNLHESFVALDTMLNPPLKNEFLTWALAEHDYEVDIETQRNLLPLHSGDLVMILSKQGAERGWWKGKVNHAIGFFPLSYVRELNTKDILTAQNAPLLVTPDPEPSIDVMIQRTTIGDTHTPIETVPTVTNTSQSAFV